MTPDLEHCVKAKSSVVMLLGECQPPVKARAWLRRRTVNERVHHDRRLGL
jgi:hypothetical protein